MTDTSGAREPASPGRRLLLAEDDPDLVEMLTELLTDEGYEVDVARDGQSALHGVDNAFTPWHRTG